LARAKQTTRAEARRRHRLTVAQADPLAGETSGDGESAAGTRRDGDSGHSSGPGARSSSATTPARTGLTSAFRGAYRPPHVREDIAALPELIRGRWFLISLGLVVVGFAGWLAVPSTLTFFLLQTVTLPPAMIPIFLVGFTAPRASYLLGLIVGIVDVLLYSLLVVTSPTLGPGLGIADILFTGIAIGLPASLVFASGAAWYKRFLALSSGRRQPARGSKGRATTKAASRR
jgi:hypothetical protein